MFNSLLMGMLGCSHEKFLCKLPLSLQWSEGAHHKLLSWLTFPNLTLKRWPILGGLYTQKWELKYGRQRVCFNAHAIKITQEFGAAPSKISSFLMLSAAAHKMYANFIGGKSPLRPHRCFIFELFLMHLLKPVKTYPRLHTLLEICIQRWTLLALVNLRNR